MKERAPYKYLDYYTFEDADIFFGREEETQKMVGEILSTRLLVLFSPSGSGKTSLINAGVRPALEKLGYRTVYARFDGPDPVSSVRDAVGNALNIPSIASNSDLHGFLARAASSDQSSVISNKQPATNNQQPLVLFLDQFEEFFIVFENKQEARQKFIEQVAKIKYDDALPVFLVFSLREDYFANLHEFREAIPSIFQNNANLRLEPFTEEEAARAIAEPVKQFGYEYDESLVQTLVADLKNGNAGIEPIALQIVCHTLWQNRPAAIAPSSNATPSTAPKIDATVYKKCHGVQAIINEHMDRLLRQIPQRQQGLMVRIFEALKTRDNTKLYRRLQDLQETLRLTDSGRLKNALQKLAEIGVLRHEQRKGDDWYEFRHDHLMSDITKWMQKRRDKISKRRLLYALTPSVIVFLGLLIFFIVEYNTFYVGLTNKDYPQQQEEIYVARRFAPSGEVTTTGLLINQVRDHSAVNALRNKLPIGLWDKNNWALLENQLDSASKRQFLQKIERPQTGTGKKVTITFTELNQSDKMVNRILMTLKDKNWTVRSQTAKELGEFGKRDERIINALLDALNDQSPSVRSYATVALGKLNQYDEKVNTAFLLMLKDKNWNVRSQAARILGDWGQSNERMIAALIDALKDPSPSVRSQAAAAIGKLGQGDEFVIPALLTALKDKDWNVRSQATRTLGNLGQSDKRVIAALLRLLKDRSPSVRSRTAEALGKVGQSDEQVIVALIKALKDQYSNVRSQTVKALGELGQSDDRVIAMLVTALQDDDSIVRAQAAGALGKLGQSNESVIATLRTALRDDDSNVRSQAARALGNLGYNDELAIVELVMALQDDNSDVRSQAGEALGKLGQNNERVITALTMALRDDNSNVRSQAMQALGKLSQGDERVITSLEVALKDQSWSVRSQAVEVLGKLNKSDERILRMLLTALKDENEFIRGQAATSLGKLEHMKPLPRLLVQLAHPLSGYRIAAAQALAQKDIPIDSALQVITKLREDDRPWVRLGAWEAYELLEPRRKAAKKSAELLHEADSLFASSNWQIASGKYESAFEENPKVTRIDSLNAARAKFQQVRCAAKLKRIGPALDDLKIAFEYNPTWRETLQAELAQPNNDWAILQGNWYLREVLLKKR